MESGCGCLPAPPAPGLALPPPPTQEPLSPGRAQSLTGALLQRCRHSPLGPLRKLPWGLPSYRTTCKEASLSHLPGAPIDPVNVAGTAWHSVLWPHP